jgi:hypothetical protein
MGVILLGQRLGDEGIFRIWIKPEGLELTIDHDVLGN